MQPRDEYFGRYVTENSVALVRVYISTDYAGTKGSPCGGHLAALDCCVRPVQ
ncbi:hypothetical protein [Nocardia brasiliensis]|uniref:hypothetical protein n=1 Tax=Nocardia brasiliensis TaxID=37326 RepID=UPI002454DFEA|nr:hypothetical protein [Nocardia brasiliensis]